MIHYIYIVSLIIITLFVIVYYYIKNNEDEEELQKIVLLEALQRKRNNELERLRSQTQSCPYGNFEDPRTCYIGSDKRCTWNVRTKRCEDRNR
jgi:hypothetical protein